LAKLSKTFILEHIHSIYTKTKVSFGLASDLNWGGGRISTNQQRATVWIRYLIHLFIQISGTSQTREMSSLSLISYIFFSYISPLNEKRHIICTVHTSTFFVYCYENHSGWILNWVTDSTSHLLQPTFLPSLPTISIPYWYSQSRQSKICNVFESTITNCYVILLHILFFYVCPHHCPYQIPRHSDGSTLKLAFLALKSPRPRSHIGPRTILLLSQYWQKYLKANCPFYFRALACIIITSQTGRQYRFEPVTPANSGTWNALS